jgi:hypothetical protein
MAIKYIYIFQSEALKIYPNWDFWFEKKPSGNPEFGKILERLGMAKVCHLEYLTAIWYILPFFNYSLRPKFFFR